MDDNFEIDELIPLDKETPQSVLLNFEHGEVPHDLAKTSKITIVPSENKQPCSVIAQLKGNTYSGVVGAHYPSDSVQTYVGLIDKRTRKLRIIEVDQCSLRSDHYRSTVNSDQIDSSATDKKHSLKTLLKEYSSKQARVMVERKERMNLDTNVIQDELNSTVNKTIVVVKKEDDIDNYIDSSSIVPPINMTASSLEEVYDVNKLVRENLINRLDDEVVALLETDINDIPITHKPILQIISTIQSSKKPVTEQNKQRIKLCIYLDALINFWTGMQANKNCFEGFSGVTSKVETDIRQTFAENLTGKLRKNKFSSDKALCYIIVLLILVCDKYQFLVDDFLEMVPVGKRTFLKFAVQVSVGKKGDHMVLKLPKHMAFLMTPQKKKKRQTL